MMKKLILLAVIATSMTAMSCAGNSENNANGTDSAAAPRALANNSPTVNLCWLLTPTTK